MAVLDVPIATGADDGRWTETVNTFTNNAAAIFMGQDGSPVARNGYYRFQVTGPANGDTITAVYITFQPDVTRSTTTVNLIISAIDDDNPAAPTTYAEAETPAAGRTTANVAWNNVGTWTANVDVNTPDFAAVIQEIIDRPGWSSGNYMVIYVEDNGSSQSSNRGRSAKAYEASTTVCPRLHIEWTAAAGGSDSYKAQIIEIGGQFGVMTLPTGGAGLVVI